jgi:hypothetical protein
MNRYNNIATLTTPEGKKYYPNIKYPEITYRDTDFYVISQEEDRYDLYAVEYYNDPSLWWIIPMANPKLPFNSLYPPLGLQIRIPTEIAEILSDYELLNR